MKRHPSTSVKVAEAAKAAQPPVGDKEAQAKAGKAVEMGAAPAAGFDKAAFIAAVKDAIDRQSPKTLGEADEFGSSGKADSIAGQVKGLVNASKDKAAKPMADASAKPPDTSKAREKDVTPLPGEPPVATPKIASAQAAPARAPPSQTDLRHGPATTAKKMADAGVTDTQLAKSNEPEFTGALAAKNDAAHHAATNPKGVRAAERGILAGARKDAGAAGALAATGMLGARTAGTQGVTAQQQQARSKDEAERATVTREVTRIFDATKTDVDGILNGIDAKVDTVFTAGEFAAKLMFTSQHKSEMRAFKLARYGGPGGGLKWAADEILGPEPEVERIFQRARATYEREMTKVITNVANVVSDELTAAKKRITKGRTEIDTYVKGLKPSLRKVGAEAATAVGSRFDQLEQAVDDKGQALAEDLAAKYVEARNAVDEEITKMQEEHKGLVDKAADAIDGAIETIGKLRDMLSGVLARAAGAISKIIDDPSRFLGNLVNAVKSGVNQFGTNILTHLKRGLQSWLFGALGEAGIQIPETFDLKGIVQLVLSILGLTVESIKAKIAAKLPPGAIEFVEKGFGFLKVLITEGIGGLWRLVLEKVGDIKQMIISQVTEMVTIEIIKAGIVWLVSLLNPASAFIKACKLIYDVIMFFVNNAARIKAFVDSILDSVESIAAGGVGAVANLIERTLGRMVPILIGFLASILGLGGISEKIKKIIETIQKPVNKVIDWVVGKAIAFGKKAWALAKRGLGALKAKGKAAWGKVKAKGAAITKKVKEKLGIKEKTPEQIEADKKDRLDKGVAAGVRAVDRFKGKFVGEKLLRPLLAAIRARYRMKTLEPLRQAGKWAVRGVVNPETTAPTQSAAPEPGAVPERRYLPTTFLNAKWVRPKLYFVSGSLHSAINQLARDQARHLLDVVSRLPRDMRPEGREQIQLSIRENQLPPSALAAFDNRTLTPTFADSIAYDIDHKVSIAEHWVTGGGHTVSDDARRAHARDLVNLKWVTAASNRGKGSAAESGERFEYSAQPWVSPSFSSTRESADRLSIGGLPYTAELP